MKTLKEKKKKKEDELIDLDAEMGIFYFLNALEENNKYPDTFRIFDEKYLEELQVGDSVKVSLKGEPFWVDIIKIEGFAITAMINSYLFINKHLKVNSIVNLKPEHVLDIYPKDLNKFPEALQEIKNIGSAIHTNIKRINGNFNNPYFINTYKRHKNNINETNNS